VEALADLPAGTVVDGEVVAIDDSGRQDFNLLQNFRAEASRIHYCIFDLLRLKNRDVTGRSLIERRGLLKSLVVIRDKRIRVSDYLEATPEALLSAERGLEGIIGKQKDRHYQPGKRSGGPRDANGLYLRLRIRMFPSISFLDAEFSTRETRARLFGALGSSSLVLEFRPRFSVFPTTVSLPALLVLLSSSHGKDRERHGCRAGVRRS
jgi:hypothetical protein